MREEVLYDMTNKEMLEMRMNGATFQEIADKCGMSKQAVHERLKLYALKLAGKRGKVLDINTIRYEGLYEYFLENLDESIHSFINKVYDTTASNKGCCTATMKRFLQGETESRFNIRQIKKICEICGMPFEEVFRERKINVTDTSVSLVDGHTENSKAFWEDTH